MHSQPRTKLKLKAAGRDDLLARASAAEYSLCQWPVVRHTNPYVEASQAPT